MFKGSYKAWVMVISVRALKWCAAAVLALAWSLSLPSFCQNTSNNYLDEYLHEQSLIRQIASSIMHGERCDELSMLACRRLNGMLAEVDAEHKELIVYDHPDSFWNDSVQDEHLVTNYMIFKRAFRIMMPREYCTQAIFDREFIFFEKAFRRLREKNYVRD